MSESNAPEGDAAGPAGRQPGSVGPGGSPVAGVSPAEEVAGSGEADREGAAGHVDKDAGALAAGGGDLASDDPDESDGMDGSEDTGTATADTASTDGEESPDDTDDPDGTDDPASASTLLIQEGEIAGDYLEQLLDILDYDGDIDMDVEGGRSVVAIVGAADLDPLVGSHGATLDALQELTRLAVAQQTGVRTRLMLDVGGYRAGRRTELSRLADTSVSQVIDTGQSLRLSPMNAFERKIVHDVVTATAGVRSESEGEDPGRRVVILPDR